MEFFLSEKLQNVSKDRKVRVDDRSVFTELRLPQTQIAADALKIQNPPPSLESVVT